MSGYQSVRNYIYTYVTTDRVDMGPRGPRTERVPRQTGFLRGRQAHCSRAEWQGG